MRIASDLHNEFENFIFPPLPDDKETVLVLAGDIGILAEPETYEDLIKQYSKQFNYVFWIAGNHEYYHGNIDKLSVKSVIDSLDLKNVYTSKLILEREKIAIIGDTLWTDLNSAYPYLMDILRNGINDYSYIRTCIDGKGRFTPERSVIEHDKQKKRIFEAVDYYSGLGFKCIVVSHHAPSVQSVVEEYKGDDINFAFYSDLDEEIKRHKIDTWIHGHTHKSFDYMIGDTKVICNPKGYPNERFTSIFNPVFLVDYK